jgi:hypothetical protein
VRPLSAPELTARADGGLFALRQHVAFGRGVGDDSNSRAIANAYSTRNTSNGVSTTTQCAIVRPSVVESFVIGPDGLPKSSGIERYTPPALPQKKFSIFFGEDLHSLRKPARMRGWRDATGDTQPGACTWWPQGAKDHVIRRAALSLNTRSISSCHPKLVRAGMVDRLTCKRIMVS